MGGQHFFHNALHHISLYHIVNATTPTGRESRLRDQRQLELGYHFEIQKVIDRKPPGQQLTWNKSVRNAYTGNSLVIPSLSICRAPVIKFISRIAHESSLDVISTSTFLRTYNGYDENENASSVRDAIKSGKNLHK